MFVTRATVHHSREEMLCQSFNEPRGSLAARGSLQACRLSPLR
jgi:hypothetical protein